MSPHAPATLIFESRRRHTRFKCDWSSDVCSSDLGVPCSTWMFLYACSAVLPSEPGGSWAPAIDAKQKTTTQAAHIFRSSFTEPPPRRIADCKYHAPAESVKVRRQQGKTSPADHLTMSLGSKP